MSGVWRSFLSRPRPLFLSSFRLARRHGSQLTTVNDLIGSRGYASNSNEDMRDRTKRHPYVVLDDHKEGFGIHKLDLAEHNDDSRDTSSVQRLPDPPFLRVMLPTLGERAQFAAVGSTIVAIGTTVYSPMLENSFLIYYDHEDMGGILIYDTRASSLTVAPHLPMGLLSGYKAAMAVGNSLYMLGSAPTWIDWNGGGSLHCLTTDPSVDHVGPDGYQFWGWKPLSGEHSSPWCWSDYKNPPTVPFSAEFITAYAAHASPPGTAAHEILVSVGPTETDMLGATSSFSTASSKWTRCGVWQLPVFGHAHYDGELDAWVGLHAAVNEGSPHVTSGHLAVGNIMSAPTEWKVGREKLFRLDEDTAAGWRHVDAKLVPIATTGGGGGMEYCLMELAPGTRGRQREERVSRASDGFSR